MLAAAGLLKYVWTFSGHQALKVNGMGSSSIGPFQRGLFKQKLVRKTFLNFSKLILKVFHNIWDKVINFNTYVGFVQTMYNNFLE